MAKKSKGKEQSVVRKRATAAVSQRGNKRKRGSIKEYFKGVKLEMKKVVWPTKKSLGLLLL